MGLLLFVSHGWPSDHLQAFVAGQSITVADTTTNGHIFGRSEEKSLRDEETTTIILFIIQCLSSGACLFYRVDPVYDIYNEEGVKRAMDG